LNIFIVNENNKEEGKNGYAPVRKRVMVATVAREESVARSMKKKEEGRRKMEEGG
jgi:hypothetical protein